MRITRCISRESLWAFRFIIIESEEYCWLVLYKINERPSSKVWSFKKLLGKDASGAEDMIDMIIALAESSANMGTLSENLMKTLWYDNWEYWGGGIPEPLILFYGSGEFDRQCEIFNEVYPYVGPPEIRNRVSPATPGKPVLSESDILNWIDETNQAPDETNTITATYVVNQDCIMLIADRHSEHLACAGGEPVLSAGEITFEINCRKSEVVYVSNQSTGYCPKPSSWKAVREALDKADIKSPSFFTATFEFRKCMNCDTVSIIKENHFCCSVCDSQLPYEWNF